MLQYRDRLLFGLLFLLSVVASLVALSFYFDMTPSTRINKNDARFLADVIGVDPRNIVITKKYYVAGGLQATRRWLYKGEMAADSWSAFLTCHPAIESAPMDSRYRTWFKNHLNAIIPFRQTTTTTSGIRQRMEMCA